MVVSFWKHPREISVFQNKTNQVFETLAHKSLSSSAEMEETEDTLYIRIEILGMDVNTLDIQVGSKFIQIKGNIPTKSRIASNGTTLSQLPYTKFSRTIPLFIPIDNNNVQCDYLNGILTLGIPKIDEEEHETVKVSINQHSYSNTLISQQRSSLQGKPLRNASYRNNIVQMWKNNG